MISWIWLIPTAIAAAMFGMIMAALLYASGGNKDD